MKTLYEKKNKHIILLFCLGLFVTILLFALPFRHSSFFLNGDDLKFHIMRILSMKDSILLGEIPVRVNPTFLNGYGYASGLCYPDLFLYFPALLHAIGLGIFKSYAIFVLTVVALTYFTSYYAGYKISKNKFVGVLVAMMYSLYLYHFSNVFSRAAVGEYVSTIFIPIFILGLYNLYFEEFSHPIYLIFSFTAIFYSHTITAYMVVLVSVFSFVFFIPKFMKQPKIFLRLLIAFGLILLLCAAFYLPLLEQMQAQELNAFTENGTSYEIAAIPFLSFLSSSFRYEKNGFSQVAGIVFFLLCFARFLPQVRKSEKPIKKTIDFFLITGLAIMLLMAVPFFWTLLRPLLSFLQFAWRFLAIGPFFLAVGIAIMLGVLFHTTKKQLLAGLAVLLIFFGITSYNYFTTGFPQGYISFDEMSTDSIGNGEWLPAETDPSIFDYTDAFDSNGESIPYEKEGLKVTVEIDNDTDDLVVPLLYYKGYEATIETPDGTIEALPLWKNDENKVQVNDLRGRTGTVVVLYNGTRVQKYSLWVSVLTLFGMVGYSLYLWYKKRSKKMEKA